MSRYTIYYSSRKSVYRELASKWTKWSNTANLTAAETEGMAKFFGHIAKRFGLIKEFKELGII
jgi:hypothetical protein